MPLGVPHSVLTGRVVGPRDPLWLPDDLDMAMQWRRFNAERCPRCGTRPEEWEADREAYMGDQRTCQGCVVTAQEAKNIEGLPEDQRAGTTPVLVRPPPEPTEER